MMLIMLNGGVAYIARYINTVRLAIVQPKQRVHTATLRPASLQAASTRPEDYL